jgi:hypothetical protein
MFDDKKKPLDVARHPKQIISMKVPFEVTPYAMMRKCS